MSEIPFEQRLTCTIPEACDATGIGRTKLYELISDGSLEAISVGRRRLITVKSLRDMIETRSSALRDIKR
jgi:excisionase family DNA binding protein